MTAAAMMICLIRRKRSHETEIIFLTHARYSFSFFVHMIAAGGCLYDLGYAHKHVLIVALAIVAVQAQRIVFQQLVRLFNVFRYDDLECFAVLFTHS